MKKSLPAASKPSVHLLVYAFGALFATLSTAFEPSVALAITMAVVSYLSKV